MKSKIANPYSENVENLAPLLNPDKRGTKHKTVDKLVINGQTIYKIKKNSKCFQ